MYFGELVLSETETTGDVKNSYLAHSIKLPKKRLRKGSKLTAELLEELQANGIDNVVVAQLGEEDVHEDEAALALAKELCGRNIHCGNAGTGRVNLYASRTGLLSLSRDSILACNSVDNNITIATLPENQWVQAGRMVATVKIISYAVHQQALKQSLDTLLANGDTLAIHEPCAQRAHLIQTRLTGTSDALLGKTERITQDRLIARQVELASSSVCEHSEQSLSSCIRERLNAENCRAEDWFLIIGASAISDIADVIPSVLVKNGGTIQRFGIPVDPGNLLLLGKIDSHPVIGLPGCARSPNQNGLDHLMDRLACGVSIDDDWISSLAIGGLLGEVFDRGQPRILGDRAELVPDAVAETGQAVTAVVLAAGSSERFGKENKLLADWQGEPMILATLQRLLESQVHDIVLVSGNYAEALQQVLASRFENVSPGQTEASVTAEFSCRVTRKKIIVLHNPLYASGLASSLKSAVSFLLEPSQQVEDHEASLPSVLVCLADMPLVDPGTINKLLDARDRQGTNPGTKIFSAFVPSFKGKRGNPVLLQPDLFDALLAIEGDRGARDLLSTNPGIVQSISVDDAGILLDIDTPSELDRHQSKP